MKYLKLKLIKLIYFLEQIIDIFSLFFIHNLNKEQFGWIYFMFSIKIVVTFIFKLIYYFLYILLLFLMSIKYLTSFDNRYLIYFRRWWVVVFFFITFDYISTFQYIAFLFIFVYLFLIIKYIYKQKPESIIDLFIICNNYITCLYLKIKHKVISMIKLL